MIEKLQEISWCGKSISWLGHDKFSADCKYCSQNLAIAMKSAEIVLAHALERSKSEPLREAVLLSMAAVIEVNS